MDAIAKYIPVFPLFAYINIISTLSGSHCKDNSGIHSQDKKIAFKRVVRNIR